MSVDYRKWLIAVCLMIFVAGPNIGFAMDIGKNTAPSAIVEKVNLIISEPASLRRAMYVEDLHEYVKQNSATAKQEDIDAIASLLAFQDQYVRFFAAASLGEIGPRASSAIPALLVAYRGIECVDGDLSSAAAILPALSKIGAPPPASSDCTMK